MPLGLMGLKVGMTQVYDETVDPQYLRVYVRQLRQKIEADPSTPRHVLTEPGIGYRLV